jgi:hypothetical protein
LALAAGSQGTANPAAAVADVLPPGRMAAGPPMRSIAVMIILLLLAPWRAARQLLPGASTVGPANSAVADMARHLPCPAAD